MIQEGVISEGQTLGECFFHLFFNCRITALQCCDGSCRAAAAAQSLQSCPTLCDPIDGSPPGSPVPGILEARTLEWVAISLSSAQE